MERVSKHITYNESIKSEAACKAGLDNTPTDKQLANMLLLADKIYEPLRTYISEPIYISSFFRSTAVNKLIGGSHTSQHTTGEAMDIRAYPQSNYINADLFYFISERLEFDQLIWEFGTRFNPEWVHVSYSAAGKSRHQILKTEKIRGRTVYKAFNM